MARHYWHAEHQHLGVVVILLSVGQTISSIPLSRVFAQDGGGALFGVYAYRDSKICISVHVCAQHSRHRVVVVVVV